MTPFAPKKVTTLLAVTAMSLSLAACQTTGKGVSGDPSIDAAMQRGSNGQSIYASPTISLAQAENAYKKSPKDEPGAVAFAHALRESKALTQAKIILEPFVKDKDASTQALNEMAAIHLAAGDAKAAEQYAQKAVVADPKNFMAFHNLGLALETQAKHPEAERAFRKGLEIWQGDPTNIMNNLALNLASQGYLDEATEILRKAQNISPNRTEIERNIRIVTALQQAARGPAPKPPVKPQQGT